MKHDPKLDGLAKILLICSILLFVLTVSGRYSILFYPNTEELHALNLAKRFFAAGWATLSLVVNIAIAVWLRGLAQSDSRSVATWTGLGLFGGVWAAVLYFVIPLYDDYRKRSSADSNSSTAH